MRESTICELYLEDTFFTSPTLAPIAPTTWENWFRTWLTSLTPNLPKAPAYELSLRLTNDPEIQTLNASYRHQNKPTDVLAFATLETNFPQPQTNEPLYLGDLVISVETAQRQAEEQDHSLATELAWLAAHGLLHLLGWDHPNEESLKKMLSQQEELLKKVGFVLGERQTDQTNATTVPKAEIGAQVL